MNASGNVGQIGLGSVRTVLLLCPALSQGGSLRDTLYPKFDTVHSETLTRGRGEYHRSWKLFQSMSERVKSEL